jgi:ferredoxin
MPKVTIKLDPTLCITAANCTGIAPDLFHINEEGLAEIKDRTGAPQGYELTLDVTDVETVLLDEAVESCPARAISVEKAG